MIRVFDPSASYGQANQLSNLTHQIDTAKRKLITFKSQINSAWQGPELTYLMKAIDQRIAEMSQINSQLQNAAGKIRQTAAQLQKEDLQRLKAEQEKQLLNSTQGSGGF